MGATTFMITAYGKDISDAYNNAVEDAEYEYGHDSYNGTISTTYGCRQVYGVVDGNTDWTQKKENKAVEVAYDMIDSMEKRDCKGIDLGKVSNRITHHNGWHKYLFFGWAAC